MFNVDFTTNESILITTIDIFDIRTHSIFLAILENYNNPKPEILYMSLSIHVFQKKKKTFLGQIQILLNDRPSSIIKQDESTAESMHISSIRIHHYQKE